MQFSQTFSKPVLLMLVATGLSMTCHSAGADNRQSSSSQYFSIPAQPLDSAIEAFIHATDWQIGFVSSQTKGQKSTTVQGRFTKEQALKKLLEGTDIDYRFIEANSITLQRRSANAFSTESLLAAAGDFVLAKAEPEKITDTGPVHQEDMTVQGGGWSSYNALNANTATKTDTPIMETPFSVKVVPRSLMDDQQVIRLKDALSNVSGVIAGGEQGRSDQFVIRGFRDQTVYRNGVLSPNTQRVGTNRRETANVESVEVLKGPGSILFGRAEPGGIVNVVTKQPLATPFYSIEQQFGSYDHYRTTIDATGPLTDNEDVLYRVNLAYENANSFREFVSDERVFLAPVLRWNISPRTQVNFELEYLHDQYVLEPGIPNIGNRPAPLPIERNLSEPYTGRTNDFLLVGLNWTHAFNDHWTLRHRFTFENLESEHVGMFFRGGVAADGTIDRGIFIDNFPSQRFFNSVDLTGKFETFGIEHTLLVGSDYYRADDSIVQIGNPSLPINIFSPVHRPLPALPNPVYNDKTTEWYGFYMQEQMKLPYGVHVLAGFRYDNATVDNNVLDLNVSDDDRVSPRVGLLWQPLEWLSLYGSYTENFGASNSQFRTDGTILPPETAQQWETGFKTELLDGRLSTTFAYYELTKQNIAVFDPLNPTIPRAAGEAESRGVEIDLAGRLLPGWQINGAFSYMPFAEVTKDVGRDGGLGTTGKRLSRAPELSGSLWNTYEFQQGELQGLKLGAGVIAVGQRQGDSNNTYQLPGYVTVNLLAGYSMKIHDTKVTAQLNVENLLDKRYFASSNGGNQIFYGAPLSFLGSIKVEF